MSATVHDLRLARQLRASVDTDLPARRRKLVAEIDVQMWRDREERRRTRAAVAPIAEPSEADKAALTAMDVCWRCRQPLDARKFSAWSQTAYGEGFIATHGGCAHG
jgi:hypothetical protein